MGANLVSAALLRIVSVAVALVMAGLIYSAVLEPEIKKFETKLPPGARQVHAAQIDQAQAGLLSLALHTP